MIEHPNMGLSEFVEMLAAAVWKMLNFGVRAARM